MTHPWPGYSAKTKDCIIQILLLVYEVKEEMPDGSGQTVLAVKQKAYQELAEQPLPPEVRQGNLIMMENMVSLASVRLAV